MELRQWVMPRRVINLLVNWRGHTGLLGVLQLPWRLAPLCLMWCLSRERNAQSFEDVETSEIELRKIMFNTF